ncbi:MAG: sigma-70 family RNA polymerase sigma factor [bacterium]
MLRLIRREITQSDMELVELYKSSGNKKHVGDLFNRYSHIVLGMCISYFKNQETAKDAVMDIFEKLFEDLKKHEVKNFSAWFYSVIKNYCLMKLRSEKVTVPYEYYDKDEDNFMESGDILHLLEEDNSSCDLLEECLKELKEIQKECVEHFYFENKSYKDISLIKSMDIKTVKSNIQNGRRNLKILLENKLRRKMYAL